VTHRQLDAYTYVYTAHRQEAQLLLTCCPTLVHVVLVLPALRTYAIPFDVLNEGIPFGYRVRIWCGKTRMAGPQSGEGRIMIDSVVREQYINLTDTQTDRQTATSPQQ